MSRVVVNGYYHVVCAQLLVVQVVGIVRCVNHKAVAYCHVAEKPHGVGRKLAVGRLNAVVHVYEHSEARKPVARSRGPEYGVAEHGGEVFAAEQFGVMSHDEVHVARLYLFVCPYGRVVAHSHVRRGRVARLVNVRQYLYSRARAAVECVPLFAWQRERAAHTFHNRVSRLFHLDFSRSSFGYVVFEAYAAHEVREPLPHGEAVEVAQKRSVVKSHPSNRSVEDSLFKGRFGLVGPVVRRVVELYEHFEAGEECAVDVARAVDFFVSEIVFLRKAVEPFERGCGEALVLASPLG